MQRKIPHNGSIKYSTAIEMSSKDSLQTKIPKESEKQYKINYIQFS
jgi:hypothetical protein